MRFDERGLFHPGCNSYEGYYVMMTLTKSTFFRATLHVITSATGFTIIMTIGKSISAGPIRLTSAETDAAPGMPTAQRMAQMAAMAFGFFLRYCICGCAMNSLSDGSAESIAALSLGLISSRFAATYALALSCDTEGRRGERRQWGSGREARRASRVTPRVFARGEARWRARHASAGRRTVSFLAFSMATSEAALAFAATASAAALAFSFNAFIACGARECDGDESSRRPVSKVTWHTRSNRVSKVEALLKPSDETRFSKFSIGRLGLTVDREAFTGVSRQS